MMFGAGAFGDGLFGADPGTASVKYEPVPPPPALLFDTLIRDLVLDDDGRYEGMDVVDQQVVLSFAIARGTVRHAPHVGHDFMTLPRVVGERLRNECERRAAAATPFDGLLSSGAVELLSVTVQNPKRTESRITISYRKRGETRTRTATVGTS